MAIRTKGRLMFHMPITKTTTRMYTKPPQKQSLQDTLHTFIQSQQASWVQNNQAISDIQTQLTTTVGEIQQEKGKFSSQPLTNLQGQHGVDTLVSDSQSQQLKLITTLKSGKEIEKPNYSNPALTKTQKKFEVNSENIEPLNNESDTVSDIRRKDPLPYQTPAPFPQRLRFPKKKGTINYEIYKLFE